MSKKKAVKISAVVARERILDILKEGKIVTLSQIFGSMPLSWGIALKPPSADIKEVVIMIINELAGEKKLEFSLVTTGNRVEIGIKLRT